MESLPTTPDVLLAVIGLVIHKEKYVSFQMTFRTQDAFETIWSQHWGSAVWFKKGDAVVFTHATLLQNEYNGNSTTKLHISYFTGTHQAPTTMASQIDAIRQSLQQAYFDDANSMDFETLDDFLSNPTSPLTGTGLLVLEDISPAMSYIRHVCETAGCSSSVNASTNTCKNNHIQRTNFKKYEFLFFCLVQEPGKNETHRQMVKMFDTVASGLFQITANEFMLLHEDEQNARFLSIFDPRTTYKVSLRKKGSSNFPDVTVEAITEHRDASSGHPPQDVDTPDATYESSSSSSSSSSTSSSTTI